MTLIFKTGLALLICMSLLVVAEAQSQNPTCGGTVQPERLVLTVIDESGEFPSGLTADNLLLKINSEQTPIVGLALETAKPLDVAILIDASISQEQGLPTSKRIAATAIQALDPARDRLALVSFSNTINLERPLTQDFGSVLAELQALRITAPPGYVGGGVVVNRVPPRTSNLPGSTSLWDVVGQAIEKVFGTERNHARRRAIILLSDGDDTSSKSKLSASTRIAIDRDVEIHSIGIEGFATMSRDSLKNISEQTGGTAVFPSSKDSKSVFDQTAKRLRSQYVVSFCRVTPPVHWAKIQIELTNPQLRKARLAYPRQTK